LAPSFVVDIIPSVMHVWEPSNTYLVWSW